MCMPATFWIYLCFYRRTGTQRERELCTWELLLATSVNCPLAERAREGVGPAQIQCDKSVLWHLLIVFCLLVHLTSALENIYMPQVEVLWGKQSALLIFSCNRFISESVSVSAAVFISVSVYVFISVSVLIPQQARPSIGCPSWPNRCWICMSYIIW